MKLSATLRQRLREPRAGSVRVLRWCEYCGAPAQPETCGACGKRKPIPNPVWSAAPSSRLTCVEYRYPGGAE